MEFYTLHVILNSKYFRAFFDLCYTINLLQIYVFTTNNIVLMELCY